MSEINQMSNSARKISVDAPKTVAFIGCVLMMLEGISYMASLPGSSGDRMVYIVTGIINLIVGAILFMMVEVVDLKIKLPIPYKWWIILAMGGGVMVWNFIANVIVTWPNPTIVGTAIYLPIGGYLGGLVVALAGMIEWEILPERMELRDSKFVLLVGCGMAIFLAFLSIGPFNFVVPIICIALCVLLILAIFKVGIPYEWWIIAIVASAILLLLHIPSAVILLVGFLLYLEDK
ncbi:MAG: hypothetical protein EU536_04755 [Promethearchaeota archaeon]|nr:MAG: hypothetical protein EU536_04755 [Candidatus Lokiarchaeota archaeon]